MRETNDEGSVPMGEMMGGMSVMMLLVILVAAALIALAVYLAVRAAQRSGPEAPDARRLLERRLAEGEISAEEYMERESLLRGGEARRRR